MKSVFGRVSRRTCALAIVVLGASVGAAVASIPAADGTVSACYKKRSGALRVVSATKNCRAGERGLTWNARGPRGAAGPRGATGAPGTPGPSLATVTRQDADVAVGGAFVTISSTSVGVGRWVVSATANALGTSPAGHLSVQCQLAVNGVAIDFVSDDREALPGAFAFQNLSLSGWVTPSAVQFIDLQCKNGGSDEIITRSTVTAIKVADLPVNDDPAP